jgi:regulator of sigma E protease
MLFFENIVWLLVLIGVMILVHELGHFWVARFFDVRVETFSFGFGPRLFGFRRGETDFRFSAILFGGYVKMAGEQPGDENVNDPRAFLAKPRWQRLAIAFAGPLMNVALAVVLLTGLFMFKFPKPVAGDLKGVIGHVLPDSAAAKAGLREGDRIVHIDDIENPSWQDILIKEVSSANHSSFAGTCGIRIRGVGARNRNPDRRPLSGNAGGEIGPATRRSAAPCQRRADSLSIQAARGGRGDQRQAG